MAKGRRTSLAVRTVALVFALALAALAARLWVGAAPRETSATRSPTGGADGEEGAATDPPLHREHSAEDQEALRDILRDAEGETP